MPLGDHLRANQHIHVAGMNAGQLRRQRAFEPRAVGVHAHDACGLAVGLARMVQQVRKLLLDHLGPAADRHDVHVAAGRAGPRHRFGEAAVVAAQAAVDLVEHPIGAAVRALAFPAAVMAGQHRRIAATVQKNQRLLAALYALCNGIEQWRGMR